MYLHLWKEDFSMQILFLYLPHRKWKDKYEMNGEKNGKQHIWVKISFDSSAIKLRFECRYKSIFVVKDIFTFLAQ